MSDSIREPYYTTVDVPVPFDHVQLVEWINKGLMLEGVTFNPKTQKFTFYFSRMAIIPIFRALNSPFITATADGPPTDEELEKALVEGHRFMCCCYWPATRQHKRSEWVVYFWLVTAQEVVADEDSIMLRPESERLVLQ